jgi:hypothetical protein
MDKETELQIKDMKNKLYDAFMRVSGDARNADSDVKLAQIAQGYAALVQADVADTQNHVRARVGGFPLWEMQGRS